MDQLEGIKNSIKNCKEDDYERMKYVEKQLLNKVGYLCHYSLPCNLLEIVLVVPLYSYS
jgi:hypothetical protein